MKITHYDLFAGIGGFSLSLDTVFYESEIKHIFCEWEAFPTAVLKKHWPDGTYYKDIDKMVEELTGLSAIEYNTKHGLSTVEEIRQRSKPLSKRDVSARHRELLRNIETSDVEDTVTQRVRDEKESEIRQGEPLLSGNKSERQSSELTRKSNTETNNSQTDSLREMRGQRGIQGRENKDTGTPSRLQQATGGNVAVSEMSPRVAQELQGNNLDYERTTTDTECEGRTGESRQAEGQPRLCNRSGKDKDFVILTGGFPCQEFSHAGRRKGTAGARYKWPEMLSLIHKIKPDIVVAENVRGLTTWEQGLALETVCTNLEECGYSVQPIIIPACSVGAPHKRERVWIVAHRQSAGAGQYLGGLRGLSQRQDNRKRKEEDSTTTSNTRQQLREQGSGEGVETNTTIGTSCSETNQRSSESDWERDWRDVARDTCAEIILETEELVEEDDAGEPQRKVILSLQAPARNDGMDDELPRRMDGATLRGKRTDSISASQHRKERLKACGNAIVPQVAMEIFKAIKVTMI